MATKRYKIGTTKIADFPTAKIKYKTSYPDDSGRDVVEIHSNEAKALARFNELKQLAGDVHLFVCLLKKNGEAIDEELIDSYWEEENEVA